MHLFSLIKFSDSQIERANETAQFSYDRRLSSHVLADAFGRFIKNPLEHGRVLAVSNRRSDPLQDVLEKLRELPALGCCTLRLAPCLPLPAKRYGHHRQTHNQKNHDQRDAA